MALVHFRHHNSISIVFVKTVLQSTRPKRKRGSRSRRCSCLPLVWLISMGDKESSSSRRLREQQSVPPPSTRPLPIPVGCFLIANRGWLSALFPHSAHISRVAYDAVSVLIADNWLARRVGVGAVKGYHYWLCRKSPTFSPCIWAAHHPWPGGFPRTVDSRRLNNVIMCGGARGADSCSRSWHPVAWLSRNWLCNALNMFSLWKVFSL